MFSLTYEFKLKPTQDQISLFENWLEQCRRVYNYALAERKAWYKSRSCQINACSLHSEYIIPAETPRPTYASQCKSLTQARKKIPKNYHWRVAHLLCDRASMIFVEDLNCKALAAGMLAKHCLDAAWSQFFDILKQCCFKRGVFFMAVDSRKTSQICPNCGIETGKKDLSERVHRCSSCLYTTDRDVAAAQVVLQRGLAAVGHTVKMLNEGKVVGLPMN